MQHYTIKRLPEGCGHPDLAGTADSLADLPLVWQQVPAAVIGHYRWNDGRKGPRAQVQAGYDEEGLHLLFTAWESPIRAAVRQQGGMVYTDSCMEFFFKPFPEEDDRYFNIEMNPLGIMLIGLGVDRYGRFEAAQLPLSGMRVSTTVTDPDRYTAPAWAISYGLPFDCIAQHFGRQRLQPGDRMLGNFYKCGESTQAPHWGMYQEVEVEQPDFHRPEFFAPLVLEL